MKLLRLNIFKAFLMNKNNILFLLAFFLILTTKPSFAFSELTRRPPFSNTSIDPNVLALGLKALHCVNLKGLNRNHEVLTIIDYSKPSSEKRMWVLNLRKKRVELEQLVAHGSGSGDEKANIFSNKNDSHQSSIGVFVTGEPYQGKNGLSLRLDGLENGVNDKARQRAIVVHGANYVNDQFVKRYGRLGRSWGCPAVDQKLAEPTIKTIKDGSVVFAYYPDNNWLKQSEFLHC